jgi:hypothetical protein
MEETSQIFLNLEVDKRVKKELNIAARNNGHKLSEYIFIAALEKAGIDPSSWHWKVK